jgi:SAM-dependent methyltransferase
MRMLDASRFQDADKYADYLKTPSGRLRSELAWKNLRRFIPSNTSKRRVLDVGGGTGYASVQLARMGYEVALLDGSEEMLRIAREQVGVGNVAPRISFCHGDASRLSELFDADSFDVVALAEIRDLIVRAGLEVVAEHGVRVFSDYVDLEHLADAALSQVFELESALGVRPEFATIARYIQVIALRSDASPSEVTGP